MTEADAVDVLERRRQAKLRIQSLTVREMMRLYHNVRYNPHFRLFIFPDGSTESEQSVVRSEREWIEKAVNLEVPYNPF